MMQPTFAPEELVAALNAADVAYVIVGGIAVAAHGVVRATARDLVDVAELDDLHGLGR